MSSSTIIRAGWLVAGVLALFVVAARNPVHSVLFLILAFFPLFVHCSFLPHLFLHFPIKLLSLCRFDLCSTFLMTSY